MQAPVTPGRWVTLQPAQAGQARTTSAASPPARGQGCPAPAAGLSQGLLQQPAGQTWHAGSSRLHQGAAGFSWQRSASRLNAKGSKKEMDAYLERLEQAAEEQQDSGEGGLTLGERVYHSIKLEGCDFLIGSTNDGRLDLSDMFVQDDETGIFAEPERQGEMPTGSLHFQEIPWELESLGDILYDKPAWAKIQKVYLIAVQTTGDDEDEDGYRAGYRLDLDTVFVLDHKERTLARCQVERQTENSDENNQVLCIRDGQLTVESPDMLASEEEIVTAFEEAEDARDKDSIRAKAIGSKTALEEDSEQPQDPMELMGDDFDEPDDVPAVDMQ
ncbi:hypothetical protein WJX74_004537 [Apatococcus lobatus]|uniref:Uncharacterized protein n=1 Tax=Apatococcus lobatus TaxID=904363 RepID=A0AAW1QUX0_9CHLO